MRLFAGRTPAHELCCILYFKRYNTVAYGGRRRQCWWCYSSRQSINLVYSVRKRFTVDLIEAFWNNLPVHIKGGRNYQENGSVTNAANARRQDEVQTEFSGGKLKSLRFSACLCSWFQLPTIQLHPIKKKNRQDNTVWCCRNLSWGESGHFPRIFIQCYYKHLNVLFSFIIFSSTNYTGIFIWYSTSGCTIR